MSRPVLDPGPQCVMGPLSPRVKQVGQEVFTPPYTFMACTGTQCSISFIGVWCFSM